MLSEQLLISNSYPQKQPLTCCLKKLYTVYNHLWITLFTGRGQIFY